MSNWPVVQLGDVADVFRGTSYTGGELSVDDRLPTLIGMGEIVGGGGLKLTNARHYAGRIKDTQFVRYDDIVVAMTDLTQDGRLLGSPAQIPLPNRDQQFIVSHHLQIVRCNDRVVPEFLKFVFLGPDWFSFVRGVSTGTTVRAVSADDAKRFSFPLPSLDIQSRIVRVLSPLLQKVESNARLAGLIEEELRLAFNCEFEVAPRLSGVALSEIVDFKSKRRPTSSVRAARYVPMSSLPTDSASIEKWEERQIGSGQKFVNGDVLLARITPCLENGKAGIVDFLDEGEVGWGSTEYLVLSGRHCPMTVWIYCLVRSSHLREFAIRHMTGTSGRQRCSAAAFDSYFVEGLNVDTIADFCRRFDSRLKSLSQLRDENSLLRQLLKLLVPGLVGGRLNLGNEGSVDSAQRAGGCNV